MSYEPYEPPGKRRDHTLRDRARAYVEQQSNAKVWDFTRVDVQDDEYGVVHVYLEYVIGSQRVCIQRDLVPYGGWSSVETGLDLTYEELQRAVREKMRAMLATGKEEPARLVGGGASPAGTVWFKEIL